MEDKRKDYMKDIVKEQKEYSKQFENTGINLGKIRAWGIRLRDYLGWFIYIMNTLTFIIVSEVSPFIVFPILIISAAVLLYIDIKKALPEENKYFASLNPWNVEVLERIKRIEDKVS